MANLNKIQDGHRRNVLCYCIEDIHTIRKHSFVYLNIYNVTLFKPTCHKICVVIPNVHILMWAIPRVIVLTYRIIFELATVTPSYLCHCENETTYLHNGIILEGSTTANVEQTL